MKCPYRMDEVHDCHDATKTWVYIEFGDCYKEDCPYWGTIEYSPYGAVDGCRKAEKEC